MRRVAVLVIVSALCVGLIRADEHLNWRFTDSSNSYFSSVAFGGAGSVLFAGRAGQESDGITAYHAQDGHTIWSASEPGQTMVAASAGGETVAAVSVDSNQQTILSVWTENYNGTPAWTIPIPKESVGPFGAFAPFVSANGETVVYGPRSFDGKFPSASFKPAIFWWTNVGKNRRPDLNKLDLTVWPGTRLGFTLSGDGKRGSAVVGPYVWQIDLINYDLLAQVPFKFPWRNVCSSFDGSYFAFGYNLTTVWAWDSAQRNFRQLISFPSMVDGKSWNCAFAADNNNLFTSGHKKTSATQATWDVSAYDVTPSKVSGFWKASMQLPEMQSIPEFITNIVASRDGSYIAASMSPPDSSTLNRVAIFKRDSGSAPIFTQENAGTIRALAIAGTASTGVSVAIAGSANSGSNPDLYSITLN